MRYSLAHEIAHTLFPDCADRVRNRLAHRDLEGDEWQLEALCNIAAAELLMPIGTLSEVMERRPDVDALLAEQKRFDVSTEAIFIRAARVSEEPIATFCASRVEAGKSVGRYRLDYLIPSRMWHEPVLNTRGDLLPATTAISECAGIGFTARADETWGTSSQGRNLHVECVGIPPYPGGRVPRVMGILWDSESTVEPESPVISKVRGNATTPHGQGPKIIVQVVNDATPNWGGSGFAMAIRNVHPQLQEHFSKWWQAEKGVRRLGRAHIAQATDDVWVASVVAQHGYGPSKTPRIRYAALRQGLESVAEFAVAHDATIHMPRIGCGQAGGSWDIVEELVRDTAVASGRKVTVYDLPGAAAGGGNEQPSLDLFSQRGN
jgi:O-acetyl-ADP-ribose deacetylase (regulator of RNase III)